MFNVKALAVKSWMVVGKLSILVATSSAYASDIYNPRFFEYQGGSFVNEVVNVSFGWFKTLDNDQKDSHAQAVTHALMFAENGQKVEWYKNDASGFAVPVITWPTGSGYCRRLHLQVIAYNMRKTMQQTACYSNPSRNWQWVRE